MDPQEKYLIPVTKRRLFSSKKIVGIAFLALFLVIGGIGFYYYNNRNLPLIPNNVLGVTTDDTEQKENENVLEKVGKLTIVPPNEIPEIATVADITKLSGQTFFANAKNGDKVLIYRKAKRVIIYRPEGNKIIDTGPLIEPSPVPAPQAGSPTPTQ